MFLVSCFWFRVSSFWLKVRGSGCFAGRAASMRRPQCRANAGRLIQSPGGPGCLPAVALAKAGPACLPADLSAEALAKAKALAKAGPAGPVCPVSRSSPFSATLLSLHNDAPMPKRQECRFGTSDLARQQRAARAVAAIPVFQWRLNFSGEMSIRNAVVKFSKRKSHH